MSRQNDGIVIYSTSGSVMFSSNGDILDTKKPPRKHRVQKNITNKSFDLMRKINDEEFWDNILIKFSRNMFYNDYRFIGNTLYYKIKSKNHKDEIFIDPDNLEETFDKFKDFNRNKGIIPVKEVVDDSEELIGERPKIENWKDSGKNQIVLLYNYIEKLKKELKLNNDENKHLESLLKISIYNNILGNEHILLKDEEIDKIKFLKWDKENRKFSLDIDNIKIKSIKQDKKNEEKYYTISSFSDDRNITLNKEVEIESIEKKWDDFLASYYLT